MCKKPIGLIVVLTMVSLNLVLIGCSREKWRTFFASKEEITESDKKQDEISDIASSEKIMQPIEEKEEPAISELSEEYVTEETLNLKKDILLIADFNSGQKPNNLGGDFGAWDKDPKDFTQFAIDSFVSSIRHGTEGYAVQIVYDVASPESAYNGFWMDLRGLDATEYNNFNFWIKGDNQRGFTKVFKIELKNTKDEVGKIHITGITDQWQKVSIPLSEFKQLSDFSSLREFVIVFEDRIATAKEGAIYIDDMCLSK